MTCQNSPFELKVLQGDVPRVKVEIRGTKGSWQGGVGVLDTGAAFTMASADRFRVQFDNTPIIAAPRGIITANSWAVTGCGRVLTITLALEKNSVKFDVSRQITVWENPNLLPDKRMDILLGCDFMAFAKMAFLGNYLGSNHLIHFHATEQSGWDIIQTS